MSLSGARRRGRGYALQVLFALDDESGRSVDEAIHQYWHNFDVELPEEVREFAGALARGTRGAVSELDETIQNVSKNWRVERMSRVDRNVLRLGTYELKYTPDTPARVVLNEAVELAKEFGAEGAPAFVNGLLDSIAGLLRPNEE